MLKIYTTILYLVIKIRHKIIFILSLAQTGPTLKHPTSNIFVVQHKDSFARFLQHIDKTFKIIQVFFHFNMASIDSTKKVLATVILIETLDEKRRKRGKTRKWIKRRESRGFFNTIVKELRLEDTRGYKEMLRIHSSFLFILRNVEDITPKELTMGGNKLFLQLNV